MASLIPLGLHSVQSCFSLYRLFHLGDILFIFFKQDEFLDCFPSIKVGCVRMKYIQSASVHLYEINTKSLQIGSKQERLFLCKCLSCLRGGKSS